MAKVYLETSFFSACVTARLDVDSQSWKGRSLSWLKTQAPRHELFISAEVIDELSAPAYPQRNEAIVLTIGIARLTVTDEVLELAQMLIENHVMPGPIKGDALHVAAAAFHGMDYLLSWNVKHLANPNKRVHLTRILTLAGRITPMIITPDLLWED